MFRLPDGTWRLDPRIQGVSDDTRRLRRNSVFVAITGTHDDGHRYLTEAVDAGACAVVVDIGAQVPDSVAQRVRVVRAHSTRLALGEIASAFYGHPSRRLHMVGVTGTNGKTTVAHLLAGILNTVGEPTGIIGTLGPKRADGSYPLTTPFPVELQEMLRMYVDQEKRTVVMEVSSHGLAQRRVAGVEFDTAILTSLGRDHLDYHRTLQAYWASKTRLFKSLSGVRHKVGHATAVLPLDGPGIAELVRHVRVETARFGLSSAADVRARGVRPETWGTHFYLESGRSRAPVSLALPGAYNVLNALAAAAAALAHGVPIPEIARALSQVQGVPGRGERIPFPGREGFAVIDYAHNPDGLERILSAARRSAQDRTVVSVFGGRGHRDPGKLPGMGETAARYCDRLILTTDSPLDEDPLDLARAIADGIPANSPLQVSYVADRAEAIQQAVTAAMPDGIVVISGRGHEDEQWIGDQTLVRTDRDMVAAALESL